MTQYMIGKVLQGRYQIVQTLGAGVFGQTYIAVDIDHPENPKCVVKQLKVTGSQPSYLDTLRLRFLTETETLKQLGHHNQIPELLACFEEDERFYLVQEFIEGHALTAELPMGQQWGSLWTESEVIQFLNDVLEILEFVHSQGVIHCDIKPENLIRRACDRKLVLIDFGSIVPVDFGADAALPIYRLPVTSLGYIPPEQFISQAQPNSDIYSLGMIAIQGLTGLAPLQLKIDPYTNDIYWRLNDTPVNDYLAAVLSQMIRYNHESRFQSAVEVLQVLKQMPLKESQVLDAEYTVSAGDNSQGRFKFIKSPSLVTGMRVGLAANSLVMGFGVYSLANNSPAYSETEALYKATEQYQAGNLESAIALARTIKPNSSVYSEAQATIGEWRQQWQLAAQRYQAVEKAFNENRWTDVLRTAAQVPDILYWQSKTDKLAKPARANLEVQSKDLLAKAYQRAGEKDFSTALNYLQQIPQESSSKTIVQQKLTEYNQKQQIRAAYFVQKAYDKAAAGDFDGAVELLQQVPQGTPIYAQAQAKLIEYTQKQRLQAGKSSNDDSRRSQLPQDEKVATSPIAKAMWTNSFIHSKTATKLDNFQPGNYMQEVNIR
ncbi:protein kinase domain-containing protein [Tolypothrix sp. VBCCA 56010]|uniref:protein kinase domain-containing protein n=1 Tax=Tolypothrix sp. VBCCA 56010 TaxID=3137731 RepID=UPI003D7C5ECA